MKYLALILTLFGCLWNAQVNASQAIKITPLETFQIQNAKILHSDEEFKLAWWQSVEQQSVGAATAYQGPGDVFTFSMWWSCARGYNLAYANGTNPACDLVDATTGAVAICTLRIAITGFVDLTGAYCTGSTTPAVACAAAAGGACKVSRAYDQTGGGNHVVNATVAQMPLISFAAIGTLPAIDCGTGGGTVLLATAATFTGQAAVTMSVVYKRTAAATNAGAVGYASGGNGMWVGSSSTAANSSVSGSVIAAATDNAWHGVQGFVQNGGNIINRTDALSEVTVGGGVNPENNSTARICRGFSVNLQGLVAEAGIARTTSTSTDRLNIYTNQNGANGYNGAF